MARRPRPAIPIADGEADTAQVAAFERDRRELLRRGIAAGGAAVAASSIPLLLSVRDAFAKQRGDLGVLESAIKLERVAVLAYDTMIGRGLLSPRARRIARHVAAQEQEHVDGLVAAMTALRATPPPKQTTVKDIDAVAKGIGDVRSQSDILAFAIELETAIVAAYDDAIGNLIDDKLLQTAASIVANEGQHLVLLRRAAGKPPVPHAFEPDRER
jgi:rubrerythrin